jgi:dihydroorotate dehydrogenase (NAD+) catalytic subunit
VIRGNPVQPDLSVRLGKLLLKNPVMTASGAFGYGREYEDAADLDRLGGIVTKAVTLKPRPGNPPPRIIETASGMLNAIGLANVGVKAFIEQKMPFLRTVDTCIVVNVAGSTVEEYVAVSRRLDACNGVDALEINISCPNVKVGGISFGADPKLAFEVLSAVRKATTLPLIAKLTPNVTDIAPIARAAEEAGADALSLINTLYGMAVDVGTRKPLLGNVTGGLSGPAIKPVALAMVWRAASAVGIPVIGIGGIMSAMDVLEFIIVGATAIQVGTANFVDPGCPVRIVEELGRYCVEQGVRRISELVGTLDVE